MTLQLVEQGVESVVGDFTFIEYTVRDDETGFMRCGRLKFPTNEMTDIGVDLELQKTIDRLNNPPPPPQTIRDVLAKIDEVNADTKLSSDEKLAALLDYKQEIYGEAILAEPTPDPIGGEL